VQKSGASAKTLCKNQFIDRVIKLEVIKLDNDWFIQLVPNRPTDQLKLCAIL